MAPQESVNMLVLETDEPHPDTHNSKGGFGKIINELFTTAGNNHDPPLGINTDMRFIVDDPENGHHGKVPTASEIDDNVHSILITGSMYDAHGDNPWILKLIELIKELWRTRPDLKFSGICFGHQLLSRTLGAKVEGHPDERWELSHTKMDLTEVGKKLFRTKDDFISIHQMHQDHVTTVPSPDTTDLLEAGTKVHVWASTEHTEIQGLYIRDRLFSTQGHLGFDKEMVKRQIDLRKKSGAIDEGDDKEVKEAEGKAHLEHDGEIVAAAILRFFHGDDHDIE